MKFPKHFIVGFLFSSMVSLHFCEAKLSSSAFTENLLRVLSPHFKEVKTVSQRILNLYPSSEYRYVGIGRSPTLFTATLMLMGADVSTLPVTDARKILNLEEQQRDQFQDYLIERLKRKSKKKILFIDFVNSGESVLILDSVFASLQKSSHLPEYSFHLLSQAGLNWSLKRELTQGLTASYSLRALSRDLGAELLNHNFDYYAPYFEYRPLVQFLNGERPAKNPLFLVLRQLLAQSLNLPELEMRCIDVLDV